MAFELTPAFSQALINDILHNMLNHFVFVYLEDILIFFRSQEKPDEHMRLFLLRV